MIEQQASETFDPAAYKDDVRERIEKEVQKKIEGQEITMPEAPEPTAQVIDLMEALRASLDKKKAAAPGKKPAEAQKKPVEARKPAKRAQHAEPAARKAARK